LQILVVLHMSSMQWFVSRANLRLSGSRVCSHLLGLSALLCCCCCLLFRSSHSTKAIPVLKVKAHHCREQQQRPAGQSEAQQQAERDHKRQRLDSFTEAAASVPPAAVATAAVKESTATAEASCNVPVQQGSNHATAPSNTATCSRANASAERSAQSQQQGEPQGKQEEHGGLSGLLGYSSESDGGEEDAKPGNACQAASIPQQGLKLPSAAELLEQDMPSSFARGPSATEADEDAPVPVVGSASRYQHHNGWI
jgi:hypothetical protein